MKALHIVTCFLIVSTAIYADGNGLRELLPDANLNELRLVPVSRHADEVLTIKISYSKKGYFEDSDQYGVLLIPKERRENWGFGVSRSRITRDGDGFAGNAYIRNLSSEGFDIEFNIKWRNKNENGNFSPTINALWKPMQTFDIDGARVTVEITKNKS